MIPIPETFDGRADQRGYSFKLIQRMGKICLFAKRKSDWSQDCEIYEVVRLQDTPKTTFPDGRVMEAHESLPRPEKWGTDGWSYATLEPARARFYALQDTPTI